MKKLILLMFLASTISCEKSKEEKAIYNYVNSWGEEIFNKTASDMRFKILNLEKVKTIMRKDTLSIIEKKIREFSDPILDKYDKKDPLNVLEKKIKESNKDLNFLIDNARNPKKYLKDALIISNEIVRLLEDYKKIDSLKTKIYADVFKTKYTIENPFIGKQTFKRIYYINNDKVVTYKKIK